MIKPFKAALIVGTLLVSNAAQAEDVEIYLVDMLDNTQNGYCLDIAGGREADADPDDGLQGHTCYSPGGALGVDQTWDSEKFSDKTLYMTKFDVCAVVPSNKAGTAITLADCDGSEAQNVVFTGEGTISPASAPEMCFTVGEDTRSGRSDTNQIKVLSLEPCDANQAAYQTWSVRTAG
ncbi:ricin-type beta-trefoil lectin domain protein [Ahrensia kielensis]|uniref:ricin-type beta-trefoil lectin domain protein n=1 Tax=Ahrensia kielensis TaxID=76980 RepID=UPI000365198A|nr:ricin-type beta-trefoil lectin domain protein [Ahrensia kielensis]